MLADAAFRRSPALSRLLRYLTEQTISGNADRLTSSVLAVDVLGRNTDFDPSTDSSARVQMVRLRRSLESYYAQHAPVDELCIYLRPGSYTLKLAKFAVAYPMLTRLPSSSYARTDRSSVEPVIVTETLPPAAMAVIYQSPSGNHQSYRRIGIVIIAGIAAVAAILLWQRFGRAVSPTLSPVLELAPMETGGQPELTQTARFVNNMFASELPRFKLSRIRVLNEGDAPRQPTERENVYQLSSQLVANEADGATLYLSIDDVRSDTRLWSRIVKLPEGQQAMSQALLPVFGEINGPMGIIAMDGTLITKNSDAGGYPCLLKYFSFVSMRDQVSEKKVADCFKQPVKEPHLEATMLASRAMFAIERRDAKSDYNASLEKGLQLAQAAVLADANDGSANFALARLSYLRNDCASARFYTTRTIEINPHSPMFTSTLAALAKTCNYPQADQLLDLAYRTQNPRFAKGRLLLILASIAQKRPDRIAELASSDLPHSQYNRTNYYLAETLIAASQGRREDAVRLLNLFIKNVPPGNGSLDEALSTIVSIPDRRRLLIKYLQNSGVLQNDGKKSFPSRVSA